MGRNQKKGRNAKEQPAVGEAYNHCRQGLPVVPKIKYEKTRAVPEEDSMPFIGGDISIFAFFTQMLLRLLTEPTRTTDFRTMGDTGIRKRPLKKKNKRCRSPINLNNPSIPHDSLHCYDVIVIYEVEPIFNADRIQSDVLIMNDVDVHLALLIHSKTVFNAHTSSLESRRTIL